MTIIVTRPQGDGQELCDLLNQQGIETLHHPLVEFSLGDDSIRAMDDLCHADMVIFVSRHAVRFLAQALHLKNQQLPKNVEYFAIGEGTAQAFNHYFLNDQLSSGELKKVIKYPNISDSEHLLYLDEFKYVDSKNICIFRGNSGRELIFQTLKQKGAKIQYNGIYQRKFISFNAEKKLIDWQNHSVTGIIITSAETLDFFCKEMFCRDELCKETHTLINVKAWLTALNLFVPSQRVAEKAKQLGFTNIINTQGASNAQIVKHL